MESLQDARRKEINKLIDYIYANLDKPLTLADMSGRLSMSPYHFHRVFTSVIGETLARFILRVRLERGAAVLSRDSDVAITTLSYECGFSSVTVFCRNFKKHFGMTPVEFRNKNYRKNSKNSLSESINEQQVRSYTRYFCPDKKMLIGGKTMNCIFEIKELSEVRIIYCRHQGAYSQMQDAFGKLIQWAYPRGLMAAQGMKLLSVYHDDPTVTSEGKLTSDAGMIVTSDVKVDGGIGKYTIEGGLYAVGRFEITMEEFPAAWNMMFTLLAEHGCLCTNDCHYEVYQNDQSKHPEKKFIVDICIPVKIK